MKRVWTLGLLIILGWANGASAETAKLRGLLKQSDEITALEYSPDGKMIATAGGKMVRLWDAKTGKLLRLLKHSRKVVSLSFGSNGIIAVANEEDKAVKIWDADTGKLQKLLGGSDNAVKQVVFSPNGEFLATANILDIKIWEMKNDKIKHTLKHVEQYGSPIVFIKEFSPDNKYLLVCTLGDNHWDILGMTSLWDVKTGRLKWKLKPDWDTDDERDLPVTDHSAAFSPTGETFVLSGSGNTWPADINRIQLRDTQSGKLLKVLTTLNEGVGYYMGTMGGALLQFTSEGDSLIVGLTGRSTVRLLDSQTGTLKSTIEHSDPIMDIALSPDGSTLACAGGKIVRLWNISGDATDNLPQSSTPVAPQLKIQDLKTGAGRAARNGDSLTVNYRGTLTNGKEFDASYGKAPFVFTLGAGNVIKGWDQGLVGMKVGGKRKLTIPPVFGYGALGSPPLIPPNATLVFEVELLKIN